MAPFLKAPCLFSAPSSVTFLLQSSNRKRNVQSGGRTQIQISIQEDPEPPNPSRPWWTTFRDTWKVRGREGCHVCILRPPVLSVEHGGSAVGPPLCPCLSRPRERTGRASAPFSGPWDSTHVGQGTAHLGCLGAPSQNREAKKAELVPSQLPKLWI